MHAPRIGTLERIGFASMPCPKCGKALHTDDALSPDPIPHGLRFRGLFCPGCGESFTVELTDE
jgi:ribosomal protein S27AE